MSYSCGTHGAMYLKILFTLIHPSLLWNYASPKTSSCQAGDPGELPVEFSLSPEAWDPGQPMIQVPIWVWAPSQETTDVPA